MHIVQRGQNREPCFFSEEDYATYLYWLGELEGDTLFTARLCAHDRDGASDRKS